VKCSPVFVRLRVIYHSISIGLSYTNQHFLRHCLEWILDLFFGSCVKKCQHPSVEPNWIFTRKRPWWRGWNTTTPLRRRMEPAGVAFVDTSKEPGKAYARNHPPHEQECLLKTLSTPARNGEAGRCKLYASKEGAVSADVTVQAFAITSTKT
jgi:hypothetical protein